jgi:S-adenosylmethionine:tRNA ribosyltransferase-isomerase
MDVRDFDFDLPPELIAQEPAAARGGARLLHLDRQTGSITHTQISALPDLLRAGDLVVVNNTRVFPARLLGRRDPSGGAVECLLVKPLSDADLDPIGAGSVPDAHRIGAGSVPDAHRIGARSVSDAHRMSSRSPSDAHLGHGSDLGQTSELWEALVHPGQKLKPGARVIFEGIHTVRGEILERRGFGRRVVRLWTEDGSPLDEAVDAIGHMPLPPYIKRGDTVDDRDRYQTVFAQARGSIAAPTAGLHFTPQLTAALAARGVEIAEITLHVGYGTFQPIRVDRVEDHRLERERYEISPATAAAVTRARAEGRRVIAVGTTTTRTLEAVARAGNGAIVAGAGDTDLFLYPGAEFRVITGLLTNFHLPQSSLLMLVSAFAGRDRVRSAYDAAVAQRYRFYSYGDAMLIT